MSLLQNALQNALQKRKQTHILRQLRPISLGNIGEIITPSGRRCLDLSSNDYLNLSRHPLLKQRASEWAQTYGTSARASRLVSGTFPLHQKLEEKIARFKKAESALLFSTGWQANASLIPALAQLSVQETGHKAVFFSDRLNHASLHHGCSAAGLSQKRFRHNDMNHLERLLQNHPSQGGLRFIVTESVFSMDGDRADIKKLRALADQYHAYLILDEAHATGVLGKHGSGLGQGLADITMSTASKALGGLGAFITGSHALCSYLINHASGFIYSTALPPSILGALDAALDLIISEEYEKERLKLASYADYLRNNLHQHHYDTGHSSTQIIPIMIGDAEKTLNIAEKLEEDSFLTIAIRPPTVPHHTARLRIALHNHVTENALDRLVNRLSQILPY